MFTLYLQLITCTVCLPIVAGLLNFRHLAKDCRILFYFILLSALSNVVSAILAHQRVNNLYLYHFYTIAEYLVLSVFYYNKFTGWPLAQKAILVVCVLFTLLCLLNPLFFQNLSQFDSYTSSLEAIFVIIMSIALINKESELLTLQPWKDNPVNWFNTGLLLYFSGSMFLFLLSNYIVEASRTIQVVAWSTHATFVFFMYILFTIGFIKCKK